MERTRALSLLAITVIGLLAYSNTLRVPFYLDDHHVIVDNPLITDLGYFFDASRRPLLIRDNRPLWDEYQSRVVVMFTFAVNHRLHGLDVGGYHVVNIAIHLVNALLVYALAGLLLGPGTLGPFLAATLFVAHPIQTQAVTYISQRFTSLAALFYLLSLTTYVVARRSRHPARQALAYSCALTAAVLAMMSKETAFTLVAMLAIYEFVFRRAPLRHRILLLAPFAGATALLAWRVVMAGAPAGGGDLLGRLSSLSGSVAGLSRYHYLATELRVIVTYLRLLVLPVGQNLDYDYPIYRSFLDPPVLGSAILLGSMLGLGGYALWRSRRTGSSGLRVVAFGIFWFFVTLAVESSLIPIADVMVEHRLYLPSVGVVLAAVAALLEVRRRWTASWLAPGAVGLIAIVFAGAAYGRNAVWRHPVDFWEDVTRKSPGAARPHNNLGIAYDLAGRGGDAIREYRIALALDPAYVEAHQNLAVAYDAAGRLDDAVREMQIVTRLEPHHAQGHYNLGILYDKLGRYEEAIHAYRLAVKLTPYDDRAWANLGIDYGRQGRIGEAVHALERSADLRRDNPVAYANLGVLYQRLGRLAEAERAYRAALATDPNDERARHGLESLRGPGR